MILRAIGASTVVLLAIKLYIFQMPFCGEFELRLNDYMVEQRLSVRKDCLLSERERVSVSQAISDCLEGWPDI